MRPLLIDFYCGEGGASEGYRRAGFDVYGVDNAAARVRNYPFPYHQGDAIEALTTLISGGSLEFWDRRGAILEVTLDDIDVLAGSPPCTGYSRGTAAVPDRLTRYDRLIGATREAFVMADKPYVIENVKDAKPELIDPVMLCATEFGLTARDDDGTLLEVQRHRMFESNVFITGAGGCRHKPGAQVAGAYGGARRDKVEARTIRKGGYVPKSLDVLRSMLGTPWMTETGCFLSIPPAYTDHIGQQLMHHLATERAA